MARDRRPLRPAPPSPPPTYTIREGERVRRYRNGRVERF